MKCLENLLTWAAQQEKNLIKQQGNLIAVQDKYSTEVRFNGGNAPWELHFHNIRYSMMGRSLTLLRTAVLDAFSKEELVAMLFGPERIEVIKKDTNGRKAWVRGIEMVGLLRKR